MTSSPPGAGGHAGSSAPPSSSATPRRDGCHSSAASTTLDPSGATRGSRCAAGAGSCDRSHSPTNVSCSTAATCRAISSASCCEPMSTGSTIVDDRIAERELERMGELLRMAAEEGPERPLAIASFGSSLLDPDSHGRVVEQLRLAIDDVVSDGVAVEVAFVGPGRQRRARTTSASSTATSARPRPARSGSADPDSSVEVLADAEGLDASDGPVRIHG